MFFVVKCGQCREQILFKEHATNKFSVTVMQNHFCKADGLNYIVEIHRGFKLTRPPNPKKEPPEPDPFDPDQDGDPSDPGAG